jgi:hypothetical protein
MIATSKLDLKSGLPNPQVYLPCRDGWAVSNTNSSCVVEDMYGYTIFPGWYLRDKCLTVPNYANSLI